MTEISSYCGTNVLVNPSLDSSASLKRHRLNREEILQISKCTCFIIPGSCSAAVFSECKCSGYLVTDHIYVTIMQGVKKAPYFVYLLELHENECAFSFFPQHWLCKANIYDNF